MKDKTVFLKTPDKRAQEKNRLCSQEFQLGLSLVLCRKPTQHFPGFKHAYCVSFPFIFKYKLVSEVWKAPRILLPDTLL